MLLCILTNLNHNPNSGTQGENLNLAGVRTRYKHTRGQPMCTLQAWAGWPKNAEKWQSSQFLMS